MYIFRCLMDPMGLVETDLEMLRTSGIDAIQMTSSRSSVLDVACNI